MFSSYKFTPVFYLQKRGISSFKIAICWLDKSKNLSKYSLKRIVFIIYYIKNVIFAENIYVMNMSQDTPECTELHHL